MSHVWSHPAQALWSVLALALFAATLTAYHRQRTPNHRDAAVLFGTFALVGASEVYSLFLHGTSWYLLVGFDLGLVVHPYAMVRVVDHVRPIHPAVERGAGVAAAGGVAAVLVYGSLQALPALAFGGLLVYFVGVLAFLTIILVAEANRSQGPIRNRLILAALGAWSLILAALVYGTITLVPTTPPGLNPVDDLLLSSMFLLYFLGFATPETLARWWQSAELHHFLTTTRDDDPEERIDRATGAMCETAKRLLNAEDVLYAEPTEDGPLEVRQRLRSGNHTSPLAADGLAGQALDEGETLWAAGTRDLCGDEASLARSLEAGEAVAIPVDTQDHGFGVVLAFLQRRPLFADGAVGCLELIAQELALLREQEVVIEEREAERRRVLEAEKRAAEESERLKDEFLATMSHEIRTPMNSILGMANLLQEASLGDEPAEYVDTIEESGEHLLAIIDDILDLSKLEAGHLRLEPEAVEIRDLVRSSVALVAEQAESKGLDLDWGVDEDVPEALSLDPHRLRQVLLNLLSNAVKFTDEGSVEVRVDAEGPPDDLTLRLEVEDTGRGIPEEDREAMFQAFQQADASRTRRHKGTGLGLKISQELVDLMGGSIAFDSTVGQGTTFRVTVPTERAALEVAETLPDPSALEGERALVVDDQEAERTVAVRYLGDLGLEVDAAASLQEGLETLETGPGTDVALVDGRLEHEEENAVEAVRGAAPDLPVVAVGTHSAPPAAEEADALLLRPYDREDLQEALLEAVAPTGGDGADREAPGEGGWTEDLAEDHPLDILVVEDNPVNRKVILKILGRFGYDPAFATDGEEGLERVREGDFDLVFMDVQMPTMDGLEATRRIQETGAAGSRPRIVGLSAHAGADRAAEAREAGMDGYLEKPVEPEALREALTGQDDAWT